MGEIEDDDDTAAALGGTVRAGPHGDGAQAADARGRSCTRATRLGTAWWRRMAAALGAAHSEGSVARPGSRLGTQEQRRPAEHGTPGPCDEVERRKARGRRRKR